MAHGKSCEKDSRTSHTLGPAWAVVMTDGASDSCKGWGADRLQGSVSREPAFSNPVIEFETPVSN